MVATRAASESLNRARASALWRCGKSLTTSTDCCFTAAVQPAFWLLWVDNFEPPFNTLVLWLDGCAVETCVNGNALSFARSTNASNSAILDV